MLISFLLVTLKIGVTMLLIPRLHLTRPPPSCTMDSSSYSRQNRVEPTVDLFLAIQMEASSKSSKYCDDWFQLVSPPGRRHFRSTQVAHILADFENETNTTQLNYKLN